MRVKNWSQFQHFKDRRPPWIKLYRDLLDDMDWHELDPVAAKALVMIWLIASEDDGELPDAKKLAFRLRMSEKQTIQLLNSLSHWLEQDDISTISEAYQTDAPETETEKRQSEVALSGFDQFWSAYPKKKNKGDAEKAWKKIRPSADLLQTMLAAVAIARCQPDWLKEGGQYIPYPASWLNAKGWEDCHVGNVQPIKRQVAL